MLAAIGMAMIFFGGLSKAIWKMYVVQTGKEYGTLQKLFRILMPAGGTLALVAAIRWCCSAPWHLIISRSVWILLAGFVLGMFPLCLDPAGRFCAGDVPHGNLGKNTG